MTASITSFLPQGVQITLVEDNDILILTLNIWEMSGFWQGIHSLSVSQVSVQ
ncbi:MAG: hypothetical protein ABFC84_03390 [Veillonellales bacterium]